MEGQMILQCCHQKVIPSLPAPHTPHMCLYVYPLYVFASWSSSLIMVLLSPSLEDQEWILSAAQGVPSHSTRADVLLALDGLFFFHLLRQRTRKAGYIALLSKCILQAVCRIEADFPGCEVCKANHHVTDKNIIVLMCFTSARKWSKSSGVI